MPHQKKRDADLAIKPTPWLLDMGIGAMFLGLLGRLLWEFKTDHGMAVLFAACLLATVVFSKLVAHGAAMIGGFLSRMRRGSHIPADCRHPLRTAVKQRKFADQAWQLAIHGSMACFEAYLLRGTTWYEDPSSVFVPCPDDYVQGKHQHSDELKFFYVLQLAIWVWTGFSCKWIEERRKDYVEMMLHHCVTVMLVLFSYINGELAIGVLVLFVHDSSDVALDVMKMLNYLKLEDAHGWFVTEISFVVNLCTWFYFRLYIFPYRVLYQGSWLGYAEHCGVEGTVGTFERCRSAGSCLQSNVGMAVLACLHVFWFLLLLRIALKLLTNTKASAAGREEYEGASESDTSGADSEDVRKRD